jgi:hypothetical protein
MNPNLLNFHSPQRRERLLNLTDLRAPKNPGEEDLASSFPPDAQSEPENADPLPESPAHE